MWIAWRGSLPPVCLYNLKYIGPSEYVCNESPLPGAWGKQLPCCASWRRHSAVRRRPCKGLDLHMGTFLFDIHEYDGL
jgi:hypothetical protein